MFNMKQMMKQAQVMQKKMEEMQTKLENSTYEGEAGGGMVKAVVNGKGRLKSIKIDPSSVASGDGDIEVLEDLVVAAVNHAKDDADEAANSAMSAIAGGINMPPGMKLPL